MEFKNPTQEEIEDAINTGKGLTFSIMDTIVFLGVACRSDCRNERGAGPAQSCTASGAPLPCRGRWSGRAPSPGGVGSRALLLPDPTRAACAPACGRLGSGNPVPGDRALFLGAPFCCGRPVGPWCPRVQHASALVDFRPLGAQAAQGVLRWASQKSTIGRSPGLWWIAQHRTRG